MSKLQNFKLAGLRCLSWLYECQPYKPHYKNIIAPPQKIYRLVLTLSLRLCRMVVFEAMENGLYHLLSMVLHVGVERIFDWMTRERMVVFEAMENGLYHLLSMVLHVGVEKNI